MVSPYFFDENGNTVKNLTQWDSNQKLILESTDDITIAPKIHFCNQNSEKALVVQSSLSNNQITADVPNTLLEEPFNITAYVYLVKEDSAKTIEKINIPVRKRPKPNDYEYVDNVEIVYLSDLIREVEVLKENLKSSYELAQEGGFTGTEAEFYSALASIDVATDDEANEYLFGTT